jgi:hypothetical protein
MKINKIFPVAAIALASCTNSVDNEGFVPLSAAECVEQARGYVSQSANLILQNVQILSPSAEDSRTCVSFRTLPVNTSHVICVTVDEDNNAKYVNSRQDGSQIVTTVCEDRPYLDTLNLHCFDNNCSASLPVVDCSSSFGCDVAGHEPVASSKVGDYLE